MSVKIKVGADPEFFLRDTTTGKFVSAHGMIQGTKHDPLPVKDGAVQVDGMALEFNINPAETFEEFDHNITSVLADLRQMIDPRYEFVFTPVADFGKEYIDAQPDEAKILGCDPDFNAWTSSENPRPDGGLGFRTASGHIHVGWTDGQAIDVKEHIEACEMASKQLDMYLGIPALLWDHDTTRRKMYGNFGAYRPKPYGVEYRTLSNVWVNDPTLRKIVYKNTVHGINELMSGRQYYKSANPNRIHMMSRSFHEVSHYIVGHLSLPKEVAEPLNYMAQSLGAKVRPGAEENIRAIYDDRSEFLLSTLSYQLVHYDDVPAKGFSSYLWHHANPYVMKSKVKGLPKPMFTASTYEKARRAAAEALPIIDIDIEDDGADVWAVAN